MATKTRNHKSKPETNGTPAPAPASRATKVKALGEPLVKCGDAMRLEDELGAMATKPYYQVALEADREHNPERKRQILTMVDKLRAEQGGNNEVSDEDLATKIAYIRPIRDALFRWAEEQVGFGHIDLNCFSDGSAAIRMSCRTGQGLYVVLNLTIEG